MPQEDVLREGIVEQSPAAADNCPSLAGHVIGEPEARGEVVVILVIELVRGRYVRSSRRIQAVEEAVLLSHHTEVVPTDAEIECQLGIHSEAVLNIEAVVIFERVAECVADGNLVATTTRHTREE